MSNKTFNIQNAVEGKLKYLTSTYVDGSYSGIFISGSYIYVACGTSGLRVYTFNGTSFTLLDTDVQGGSGVSYNDVWGDGTYIYVGCDGGNSGGLRVYSFNGTNLTYKTTWSGTTIDFRFIYGDASYIYASESTVLYGFSYNGTTLSLSGFWVESGGLCNQIWCGNGYIYLAKAQNGVKVLSFNGSSFTLHSTKLETGAYQRIWGEVNGASNNIYTTAQGEYIYLFTGTTILATVKSYYQSIVAQTITGIWGDGKYVYQVGQTRGIGTYITTTPTIHRPCLQNRHIPDINRILGDANYIYATSAAGLHVFKLLEKY